MSRLIEWAKLKKDQWDLGKVWWFIGEHELEFCRKTKEIEDLQVRVETLEAMVEMRLGPLKKRGLN